MNNSLLVSQVFQVPERLVHEKFIARKLQASDVELDYLAVMSSIDIIRKLRGKSEWPSEEMTIEEDLKDLQWHEEEFERRTSFAYTVMNRDETTCLGCFYLYPPGTRSEAPTGSDVDVSFWVTGEAFKQGLYHDLYTALRDWLAEAWPFKQPHWTNEVIPE